MASQNFILVSLLFQETNSPAEDLNLQTRGESSVDSVADLEVTRSKMPENPNFVGDSGEAGRQEPVEVGSIQLNFKCLDDESPGSPDSYKDFHHQNLKSDSAASLLSILSLTSSRLSKSFSSLSKKSPSTLPCEKSSKEDEAKQIHKKKEWATRSFGLLLAFVSGVLMTAYSSMIKMLDTMDSMQVVVIRGLLQLLVMGSVARYKKMSFRGTESRRIAALLLLG